MEGALPKLLLIGANGSVGKFLVKHLAPKYAVSALLRSAPKFDVSLYPTLKIIEGDASSQQTLNDAFKGVDVVVSSYQNFKAGPTDMHDFVVRVIHAMKENVFYNIFLERKKVYFRDWLWLIKNISRNYIKR